MSKHIIYQTTLMAALLTFMSSAAMDANAGTLTEVDALQAAKPVGSAFTRSLTREYRIYSTQERDPEQDYPDAIHFARKGLATARGHIVMPEPVKDWNLKLDHIRDLASARARLLTAYQKGGRSTAPELAAKAQARFDCWAEEREENRAPRAQIPCRRQFRDAMNQLERQLPVNVPVPETTAMPPVDVETPNPGTQTAIEQAVFLTFFDFDKATISSGAANVLDAVAKEIKQRDDVEAVKVVGHTDTSGPEDYNMELSLRRARAVRDALAERGIPRDMIEIDNKGEKELLVPTPDSVREPANRRAKITFEERRQRAGR